MNRSTAIRRLRRYLREPTPATWSNDDLAESLNEAQTELFAQLVAFNVPYFNKAVDATWPANVLEMSTADLFGANVVQYRLVGYKGTSDPVSATNTVRRIEPMHEAREIASEGWWPTYGSVLGADDPEIGYRTTRYLAYGQSLKLVPPPTTDMYLHVVAVFEPRALNTDDAEIWDGEMARWHYIVPMLAALNAMVQTNDSEPFAQLAVRFKAAWDACTNLCKMSMQSQANYTPSWALGE